MQTIDQLFGLEAEREAAATRANPAVQTPVTATTRAQNVSPSNPLRALADPRNSAIFWIGLAALLGLVIVSGQLKVSAAIAARGGKR